MRPSFLLLSCYNFPAGQEISSHSLEPLQSQSLIRSSQNALLSRRYCRFGRKRCQWLHRSSPKANKRFWPESLVAQLNRVCLDHTNCDRLQDVLPIRHQIHKRHQDLYRYSTNLGHSYGLPQKVHHLGQTWPQANRRSRGTNSSLQQDQLCPSQAVSASLCCASISLTCSVELALLPSQSSRMSHAT
jgi:hypothetical protein